MTIWYVDCEALSCAWTKKEDAIKYFEEIAKESNWNYTYTYEESLEDNDYFVDIECSWTDENGECFFNVIICSIFLDEKPYLFNN